MARGPAKSFDPDKVLNLAMVEFWKRGYAATSMSNLRDVTGLGAKSLYDTYGGKRELFLAALDRYVETQVKCMFDQVIATLPADEALEKIFQTLVKIHRRTPHMGCLLGVAAAQLEDDPDLRSAIDQQYVGIRAALETALGQLAFKPSAPSPREMASFLLVLFQGANLVGRVDQETAHAETAILTARQLILAWRTD